MLTITEPAFNRLSHRLARGNAADDMALRITRRDGGWKLRPDRARPGDTTFAHDGHNVLLLDEAVSKATANMTLVVRKTDAGPRLRLRRPTSRDE
jgi:hypothetical protein